MPEVRYLTICAQIRGAEVTKAKGLPGLSAGLRLYAFLALFQATTEAMLFLQPSQR